jgi:hypothetical protein
MRERGRIAYHIVRKPCLMGVLIHGLRVSEDADVRGILLLNNLTEARREGAAILGPEHAILEVNLGDMPKGALDPELAKRSGTTYELFADHTWSTVDLGPERLSLVHSDPSP